MKGFVGGIPLALLAAAAQAQAMEHHAPTSNGVQARHLYPHSGGTAMGGPSGNDEDGGFTSPYAANVHTHTNVDEYSKDDHSIKVKNKDVYPPPPAPGPYGPVFGPGEGPFPKRHWRHGGTAMGGPSGNDEGQTFDMPITANIHTDVDEYQKDDHSIKVKNKNIHPAPVYAPIAPGFHGPPAGFREGSSQGGEHYHVPAEAFVKRWGPEVGGTAMGGPSGGSAHGFNGGFVSGGTAEGGPSGDDEGEDFGNPITGDFNTDVDEYSHDDHSIDLKHKDVYPAPVIPFGGFKRSWEPEEGGTAMGGPSGNDGGQTFSAPITLDTSTDVHEHYQDDHSIDLKHEDVYEDPPVAAFPVVGGPGPYISGGGPGPFRRAYSPDRVAGGGTAMGGPSGDDEGSSFENPTSVGIDTGVNEHHEDNHAIKVDSTTVHPPVYEVPHMPWMPYPEHPVQHPETVVVPLAHHYEAPASPPAPAAPAGPPAGSFEPHWERPAPPQAPREDHEEVPQCAAQVHEVVRTVTKTQYKEVHPTKTVYAQPVVSQVVQTSAAVPMSATPEEVVDPKVVYSAPAMHGSQFASVPAAPSSSYVPYQSYNYMPQRPASSSAAYSMIPVHVPMASSSSMMPMATPSSSMGLNLRPSGADAMHSASATPSGHMFTGNAARVSGGIASVAAAIVGVLAFVL
ncbi:hypothetical protein N7462_008896 [Penicillium macrosclerotiorum]|uniref:uncharacterized protein n=1 Tax=Penicillium macrosclerotiorum TaxID=303699 RepID=UPI002546758B|nr:uncharacterized protein N7462_008896 [Penicillium macrosclerotiorum]KAJ5675999.1 hypothetical protein N7462_008896 [Penicillium macrosclerotiorum]